MNAYEAFDTYVDYIMAVDPRTAKHYGIKPGKLMKRLSELYRQKYVVLASLDEGFDDNEFESLCNNYRNIRENHIEFLRNRRPNCWFLQDSLSYLCFNTRNPLTLPIENEFVGIGYNLPTEFDSRESLISVFMNKFSLSGFNRFHDDYLKLKPLVEVMLTDEFSNLWVIIVNKLQYTKKRNW